MPTVLTESAIAKAVRDVAEAGSRRELSDARHPGLRLRITPPSQRLPAGKRAWVLACRDRLGRMRRFELGEYPALGVSDARAAATETRLKVRAGGDPNADRRRDRAAGVAAKAGIGTLEAVIEVYSEHGPGKTLKSWPHSRKRVALVFKSLLGHPASMLKVGDLQMAADRYPARQSASFAVRTIRPVLKWAAAPGRGYVPDGLAALKPPAQVRRRHRVLTNAELAAILPVLTSSDRPYARALHLMLLTLARRDEIASARWRQVDLTAGVLTIPVTKNRTPHLVPLSRQAVALLESVGPGKPAELIFKTDAGTALANWDRETKSIQAASETSDWHRHDLRRTGATLLGEMGELPDIVEAALNHTAVRSQLAANYNRSRYRPAVAAALQRLADALDGIASGGARVVQLHPARAES